MQELGDGENDMISRAILRRIFAPAFCADKNPLFVEIKLVVITCTLDLGRVGIL